LNIRIQPSAKADIRRGYHFYEAQEQSIGSYFADSIYANIDSLKLYAGIHRFRDPHYRFCAHPFPFWIYYRIDDGTCYVVAILDARQNPRTVEKQEQAKIDNFEE
jgi:plasmid stabilization system protein ParE